MICRKLPNSIILKVLFSVTLLQRWQNSLNFGLDFKHYRTKAKCNEIPLSDTSANSEHFRLHTK